MAGKSDAGTAGELKRALRRKVLTRRDMLTEVEQAKACTLITERILEHVWYQDADVILGFASCGSEISTDPILQEILQQGKLLYLPRVVGEEMLFFRVYGLNELQVGYKGIREPAEDGELFEYEFYEKQERQLLMLMPGVAFDLNRGRMGYGKGFYDRFLADKPWLALRTIGIGYACQMVAEVPCEETDIRPAQVICV